MRVARLEDRVALARAARLQVIARRRCRRCPAPTISDVDVRCGHSRPNQPIAMPRWRRAAKYAGDTEYATSSCTRCVGRWPTPTSRSTIMRAVAARSPRDEQAARCAAASTALRQRARSGRSGRRSTSASSVSPRRPRQPLLQLGRESCCVSGSSSGRAARDLRPPTSAPRRERRLELVDGRSVSFR